MRYHKQTLLIDADDTLWETNIQFEQVIAAFQDLVAPLGHDPVSVRRQVDRIDRKNIPVHGYGAQKFLRSLEEAYLVLAGERAEESTRLEIQRLSGFFSQPRLLNGVAKTLDYLSARHHLHLFSKGDQEEQVGKFNGSGLQSHFHGWEIVPEKDAEAYRRLVARHGWPLETVWMVGNSPHSDINPALAIGLNAVFIPSKLNWDWEHEVICPGGGCLLRLERFRDLQNHF